MSREETAGSDRAVTLRGLAVAVMGWIGTAGATQSPIIGSGCSGEFGYGNGEFRWSGIGCRSDAVEFVLQMPKWHFLAWRAMWRCLSGRLNSSQQSPQRAYCDEHMKQVTSRSTNGSLRRRCGRENHKDESCALHVRQATAMWSGNGVRDALADGHMLRWREKFPFVSGNGNRALHGTQKA